MESTALEHHRIERDFSTRVQVTDEQPATIRRAVSRHQHGSECIPQDRTLYSADRSITA
jgi:hypothetical protein